MQTPRTPHRCWRGVSVFLLVRRDMVSAVEFTAKTCHVFCLMLKPEKIPTPLVTAKERAPIKIVPLPQPRRFQMVVLFFKIARFGLAFFWMQRVQRASAVEIAQYARAFLEDLGGLWIKAGQLFSLRADAMTREMAHELGELQYRSYGFAPEIARQVIQETLGRPLEEVFDAYEEMPFAAASISQEHRAHLRAENVWVVIKVQRPGIAALFERDLKFIRMLLGIFGALPQIKYLNFDGMYRELSRIMLEEIDYRYEQANLRRMKKTLRAHKIYVPKLFKLYSGTHVIVMEEIPGVLMSDYLAMQRTDPERLEAWRQENNVKARKVGSLLLRSYYRQVTEDNLIHGDLHPGNIMLLRDSRVALLDFGSIGTQDKRFSERYRALALAIATKDYTKATDLLLMLADVLPVVDLTKLRSEMVEAYRNWEARTHLSELPYLEKSFSGTGSIEIAAVSAKYKIGTSWQLLRAGRALSTLEVSLAGLLGNTNPAKIIRKYFRQSQARQLQNARKNLGRNLAGALGTVSEVAGYATETVRLGALQFAGIESKVAQVFGTLFGVLRLALIALFLYVVYEAMYDHAHPVVAGINERLGAFGDWVASTPRLHLEAWGLILVILLLIYFVISRWHQIFTTPTKRLPSGRLDH